MELAVEVQPPDSPGGLSTRHLADGSRVGELAAAIAAVSNRLTAELEGTPSSGQDWLLDEVEMTFHLDLLPGTGVVLVRDDTRHTVSVKCRFPRASESSEEPTQAP